MDYTWDPVKAASNLAKHGAAFEAVDAFEWAVAVVRADTRRDYGEVRLVALGPIGDIVFHLTFTIRRTGVRLISVRRANNGEIDLYEANLPT